MASRFLLSLLLVLNTVLAAVSGGVCQSDCGPEVSSGQRLFLVERPSFDGQEGPCCCCPDPRAQASAAGSGEGCGCPTDLAPLSCSDDPLSLVRSESRNAGAWLAFLVPTLDLPMVRPAALRAIAPAPDARRVRRPIGSFQAVLCVWQT